VDLDCDDGVSTTGGLVHESGSHSSVGISKIDSGLDLIIVTDRDLTSAINIDRVLILFDLEISLTVLGSNK
jgi:hypothetical protein